VLFDKVRDAACFIVMWSDASVDSMFVESEARLALDQSLDRGRLVPVLLDKSAKRRIPLPFNVLQHVDLTDGAAQQRSELARLAKAVGALVRRPPLREEQWGSNLGDDNAVRYAKHASAEIRKLSERLGAIGEVLIAEAKAVARLRATLAEVDKTLDVVSDAVQDFVTAGLAPEIDPRPYVRFESGNLSRRIREGRGHCDLIAVYYGAPDGVRAWLKENASARVRGRADNLFGRLAEADNDVFRNLAEIGDALTNESRVVVNLLAAGQPDAAKRRVFEGRKRLAPLQTELEKTTEVLQEIESSLGYARSDSG
jgi:hypothetical protein